MRPRLVWFVVVALLVALAASAYAAPRSSVERLEVIGVAYPVDVSVNGQLQHFDTPALVVNDRALVPLRGVLESLGATVTWHGRTGTVTAQGGRLVVLTVGSRRALVCDRPIALDVAPRLLANRVYVSTQFVREALCATVAWLPQARRIDIASAVPSVAGFRSQPRPPTTCELPAPSVCPTCGQLRPQLPTSTVCPPAVTSQVTPPPAVTSTITPPVTSEVQPIRPMAPPLPQQVQPMSQPVPQYQGNDPVVQVVLSEYKIALSPAEVPAGPVTFQIVNSGKHKHGMNIESTDIKSSILEPGQSTTLTVTLSPNTYTLYCPVDAHRELGMKARLVVR